MSLIRRSHLPGAAHLRTRLVVLLSCAALVVGLVPAGSTVLASKSALGPARVRHPDHVTRLHPAAAGRAATSSSPRSFRAAPRLALPRSSWPPATPPSQGTAPTRAPLVVNVTLTITKSGTGSGRVTSDVGGIDCGSTCAASVTPGTVVTLRAVADGGSTPGTVSGSDTCSAAGFHMCQVTVNADATIDVAFDPIFLSGSPQLGSVFGVAGANDAQLGCSARPCGEPSDSGLAIGPSQVLESTNLGIQLRVAGGDRQRAYGDLLWDVPLDDWFGVPADDVIVSDPHVAFNDADGRFYASAISATCSTGRLYIAVSSSSDALDPWTVYRFDFAGYLPDFDLLGFTGDLVGVSSNVFGWSGCAPTGYAGTDLLVMDTASLRAGADPLNAHEFQDSGLFTVVPAHSYATSSPLRVVMGVINGDALDVGYVEISGSVDGGTLFVSSLLDLTTASDAQLPAFADPPAPRQPGSPATISEAVDGRPLGAVYRQDQTLWFASTAPCTPTGDATTRSCVRYTQLVTPGDGTATPQEDLLVGASGFDTFNGGITISAGDGSAVIAYSQSSSSSAVGVYAAIQAGAASFHAPALLVQGSATYKGTRWGDFMDLGASGSWTGFAAQYPDASGGWSTWLGALAAFALEPSSGTLLLDGGAAATIHRQLALSALPPACCAFGSASTRVLVSDSSATSGGKLVNARELPAGTMRWFLDDAAAGGSTATGARTVYVQWGNGAGTWSGVDAVSISLTAGKVQRIGGANRYATAALVAESTFDPHVGTVFVATGTNYPDSLAAAPVAGSLGIPILLVTSTSVPTETAAAINVLKPAQIVILGGTGVVSTGVASALSSFAPVYRVAGADRYATAALVSRTYQRPHPAVAYVANGLNYPDALSGGAAASKLGGPVLLVKATSIPAATATELSRLHPRRIVVLGGTGVVSEGVRAALAAYTSGGVSRLAGADRYATSAAISAASFTAGVEEAYVATGLNFPDALGGGAPAGIFGGPVLLVQGTRIPSVIATELTRLQPKRIVILGGTGVVSASVAAALAGYATAP